MDIKEQFNVLIKESSLTEEDKREWLGFIELATEEFISAIVAVVSEFPAELDWFNSIYKRKKEALSLYSINRNKAQIKLSEIYTEEKNKLQLLLNHA